MSIFADLVELFKPSYLHLSISTCGVVAVVDAKQGYSRDRGAGSELSAGQRYSSTSQILSGSRVVWCGPWRFVQRLRKEQAWAAWYVA